MDFYGQAVALDCKLCGEDGHDIESCGLRDRFPEFSRTHAQTSNSYSPEPNYKPRNNSDNQDRTPHQDSSWTYNEDNSFKEERNKMLEMNKELLALLKEVAWELKSLKNENDALQGKIKEISLEKACIREEFEKEVQLLKNELEGKEASEVSKVEKLQGLNKKLVLEVKALREENSSLKKKNGEVSTKNKKFEEQIMRLEARKLQVSEELLDFTKAVMEFEEKTAQKSKEIQLVIELKDNALKEVEETLKQKDEALKIVEARESVFGIELDKVVKTLPKDTNSKPQRYQKKGRIPNSSLMCYFCSKREHFKDEYYTLTKNKKNRGARKKNNLPRVKKIWARKDQIHFVINMGKQKIKEQPKFIWVPKKEEFPNLVKPPLASH